ncbi:MAG: HAMP domain-containing protein [Thermoleophilaceae bacterium]|nr:HAMP domain-containing protein [Thermoleophilaceae bacterium]
MLALQFSVAHVVVFFGIVLLTLYIPVTGIQFLSILLVAELLIAVENGFATRLSARLLRPVSRWLDGERDLETSLAAWRVLAALPLEFLRRWKWIPLLFNIPLLSNFVAYELGLAWWSVPILLIGSTGVLAYGALLRYFAMELAMRPVIEEVAAVLPEDFEPGPPGVPLKWRLLIALPMVNVITGIVVAGVSRDDPGNLGDLGIDVAIAVAVALTISLELNLLMSRSILGPIRNLRDATNRLAEGDLTARVAVLSTDETGALAQSFNRMASGLEERERLREAFGAFVDPDVAEHIMREGVLEGHEVEVSVLFVDIRDFTAFAEQASAREVVARLNDFYERIVPVLMRHGGHANKFIGDGLLGVFGAPAPHPDHADRAVGAAFEIAELVRSHYGEELRVGMGVNSGPVLVGTVGGGGRLDFTVIGDAVNTASRVEEATRQTGDDLLITEATRCLLTKDYGGLDERTDVELKGKTERVRLWAPRPLGESEPEQGRRRTRLRRIARQR